MVIHMNFVLFSVTNLSSMINQYRRIIQTHFNDLSPNNINRRLDVLSPYSNILTSSSLNDDDDDHHHHDGDKLCISGNLYFFWRNALAFLFFSCILLSTNEITGILYFLG